MGMNPGRIEPGAGSFRAPLSAGARSGDTDPTERLNTNRPMPPQLPAQHALGHPAIDHRTRDQPARAQRTRRTVALPAPTHRALDIWQREAAARLGVDPAQYITLSYGRLFELWRNERHSAAENLTFGDCAEG